ncbi:MAG: hypothetical protein AB7E55_07725 [Pigmentiphaga sp.]
MSKELNQHLEQAEGAQGNLDEYAEFESWLEREKPAGCIGDIERGWMARAALAQPSPAPAHADIPRFVWGEDGMHRASSGTWIRDAWLRAIEEQHDRIVGALREKIDGAESQAEYQTRRAEHFAKERDAVLSRLAELEKQAPVTAVSEETFSANGTSDIITRNLPIGTPLYTAPVAQAGQAPEEWRDMLAELQWHYEPYDDHYHKDMGYYCPRCGGEQDAGHKQYCDLAKLLAAASQPGAQFTEQHQTLTKSEQIAESANHQPAKGDAAEDQLCSFCFRRGCNGECSGDGAMGD